MSKFFIKARDRLKSSFKKVKKKILSSRWNLILTTMIGLNVVFLVYGMVFQFQNNKIKDTQVEEVMGVGSVPLFDHNFVISNDTFFSTRVFSSENAIQNYLDKINSPLKNYNSDGRSASYWIFAASRGITSSKSGVVPQINPGVILAFLEKEQSLLSATNYNVYTDPENRIKTAMGYACPDDGECDKKYYGFVNQLNWAAYQLQYNYNLSEQRSSNVSPYIVNQTITTLDEYNVFMTNSATAAVYRYTPHVYWGNYNLWKIIVANGWGVDSSTYSMSEIDKVNLPRRNQPSTDNPGQTISKSDGLALVKQNYSLEQSGDQIRKLQIFLRQEGYYMNRNINGLYGVVTDQSLKNYRQDKGIIVGDFKSVGEDKCKNLINKNFNIGQENGEIGDLQRCLRDIGFFDWPVITSHFGSVTQKGQNSARMALSAQDKGGSQVKGINETRTENSCNDLKNQDFNIGESGDRVKKLQQCLKDRGLFNWSGGITGYFGDYTKGRLAEWRGEKPKPVIVSVGNSCESLKNSSIPFGETSDRVRSLQACMRSAGVFNYPSDTGYFGPVTRDALSAWKNGNIKNNTCESLKNQSWNEGETSDRVRSLQACMRSAGVFNHPSNTGYFGSVTKKALIDWRGYF